MNRQDHKDLQHKRIYDLIDIIERKTNIMFHNHMPTLHYAVMEGKLPLPTVIAKLTKEIDRITNNNNLSSMWEG